MNLSSVRAKMVCNFIQDSGNNVRKVNLGAVYSSVKGENGDFSTSTPWGTCEMGITGDVPAAGYFKPGKKYYVTFTEAPD